MWALLKITTFLVSKTSTLLSLILAVGEGYWSRSIFRFLFQNNEFNLKQESRMAYGTADEALSTVPVMFKKMFLFKQLKIGILAK